MWFIEDEEEVDKEKKEIKHVSYWAFCHHVWPDTGLLRSWCKKCGKQGLFNRRLNKFEEDTSE